MDAITRRGTEGYDAQHVTTQAGDAAEYGRGWTTGDGGTVQVTRVFRISAYRIFASAIAFLMVPFLSETT